MAAKPGRHLGVRGYSIRVLVDGVPLPDDKPVQYFQPRKKAAVVAAPVVPPPTIPGGTPLERAKALLRARGGI